MKINSIYIILLFGSLASCSTDDNNYDATGTFEATEIIISAEATGTIKEFTIEEGDEVQADQFIGSIDSLQLYYKKLQLEAQVNAVLGNKPNIGVQLAALNEQLATTKHEQKRVQNLVKDNVSPQKQLDDINAQVEIIQRQIAAQQSSLQISTSSIDKNAVALQVQLLQLNDQLRKCRIVNPVKGTILLTYADENEMTAMGKPLYKIANLNKMTLKAYVSGNQLPKIKLNQEVTVKTDSGDGDMKSTKGTIYWISDKAEFTPKTVQTKDERANSVYAIKVRVKNDGYYKIGMYGEIIF